MEKLELDSDEVWDYVDALKQLGLNIPDEELEQMAIAVKSMEKGFKDASSHLEDF